ncbi:MAG: hypothetical protein ACYTHM_04510 [Planctomycetota bacterium]|jgi:hypothetical protein
MAERYCPRCGEALENRGGSRRVVYEMFRGGALATWKDLFAKAARFAESIGPGRVISISHSADQSNGVITVWYWE